MFAATGPTLDERRAHSLPGNFFRLRLTTPENDWSHLASAMQFLLRRVRRPGFRARTRAEANNFGIRVEPSERERDRRWDASLRGRKSACSRPRTCTHDRHSLERPFLFVKGERVDNDDAERILPFNGEMIMSGYEFLDRAVITFMPLLKLTSDRFFFFFIDYARVLRLVVVTLLLHASRFARK